MPYFKAGMFCKIGVPHVKLMKEYIEKLAGCNQVFFCVIKEIHCLDAQEKYK